MSKIVGGTEKCSKFDDNRYRYVGVKKGVQRPLVDVIGNQTLAYQKAQSVQFLKITILIIKIVMSPEEQPLTVGLTREKACLIGP